MTVILFNRQQKYKFLEPQTSFLAHKLIKISDL